MSQEEEDDLLSYGVSEEDVQAYDEDDINDEEQSYPAEDGVDEVWTRPSVTAARGRRAAFVGWRKLALARPCGMQYRA
jgi:hypothetical protein